MAYPLSSQISNLESMEGERNGVDPPIKGTPRKIGLTFIGSFIRIGRGLYIYLRGLGEYPECWDISLVLKY